MKIETLVVSVNYGDYLQDTLPYICKFSDKVYVVSTPKDFLTQEVCKKNGVDCIASHDHLKGSQSGPAFNKGALLNAGIRQMSRTDWILLIDADTVPMPRAWVESQSLVPEVLYGAPRRLCQSPAEFRQKYQGDARVFPEPPPLKVNGVVMPLGYFQLWHSSAIPYGPWFSGSYPRADRTDVLFAHRWDGLMSMLTEPVLHLDIDNHTKGRNWRGRKSAPWADSKSEKVIFQ